VLEALGVSEAVTTASYAISGLRLVTPRGHDVVLSSPEDAALICNRRILDHLLLQRAQQEGARFLGDFEVSYLLQRGDRVVGFLGADGREVRADYTVVADGAHTRFACEGRPRQLIQAVMGWWEGVPFQSHHIEMIFDDGVAPYYGWLFPEGEDRVNIGICYEDRQLKKNARKLFQAFLDKHYQQRLSAARPIGTWKGHPISYGASFTRLTSPGRIVVGEAGRMTHPATAEGIYQGMHSGVLAANALHDILNRAAEPDAAFRAYQYACQKAFRLPFRRASAWRYFVETGGLDVTVGLLNRPFSRRLLARAMAHM
jgi:menaquinone-9 beta-reductase